MYYMGINIYHIVISQGTKPRHQRKQSKRSMGTDRARTVQQQHSGTGKE